MTADNLILLILAQAGGQLSGKTLLQKRAYFISKILNFQLGFKPHFYGPFSSEIENATGQCKYLILKERQAPFTVEGIQKAAGKLGWEISPEAVQKAVTFLTNSDLLAKAHS